MVDQFLHLSASDRKDILQTCAVKMGKQTAVLEKDIWVCWALQILFSMPNAHPMAFKGGTSLSKIYGVIDRFSEDVDITLDYRCFGDEFNPFAEGVSKAGIKKFGERLKGYVRHYAKAIVAPYVKSQLRALPGPDQYRVNVSDDGEKIWIQYPSAIESSDDYLLSSILIELGGRNVIDPNEKHRVIPDISPYVNDLNFPSCAVVVLSPERTFWEKVTLIHVECNRNRFKENAHRLSRHWYDVYRLGGHSSGKAAISNRTLSLRAKRGNPLLLCAGILQSVSDKRDRDDYAGLSSPALIRRRHCERSAAIHCCHAPVFFGVFWTKEELSLYEQR